jgi:hypothetical protein
VTREEIFAVWAPQDVVWSQWVKPVLFSRMVHAAQSDPVAIPVKPSWAPPADGTTAIVLDLPAVIIVQTAIALAAAGYRPVPLFNAAPGPASELRAGIPVTLVDVQPIIASILTLTGVLSKINLSPEAPPCFMLQANRRTGVAVPSPGRFDNRSVSFPTDFPSANRLLHERIRQALLVQESGFEPQPDLSHTLLRWQEAGMQIIAKELSSDQGPRNCVVRRPLLYRAIWHRFFTLIGLRRNPLGGFGGMLDQPSSG